MCTIGEKEPLYFWVKHDGTIKPLNSRSLRLRDVEDEVRPLYGLEAGEIAINIEGELRFFHLHKPATERR